MKEERIERMQKVNELVKVIAGLGRRFFYCSKNEAYAEMIMNERGRLFWVDDFTQKRIYLHYKWWGSHQGFSHGGTLRDVVKLLKGYVFTGEKIKVNCFGPWPDWYCDGDLWGYGKENMQRIRATARELGILFDQVTREQAAEVYLAYEASKGAEAAEAVLQKYLRDVGEGVTDVPEDQREAFVKELSEA